MSEKDYTFQLNEKSKFRYNAGPYNKKSHSPKYEIEVLIPGHEKNKIVVNQFLMGEENNYLWVWDIENKSTWPAFIIIYKDGQLVTDL